LSRDTETMATQRLLDVIRGSPVSGNKALNSSAVPGSSQQGPPGVQSPSDVLLSRCQAPRSRFMGRVRVGLDIGHSLVKMVKVERTARGLRLLQVGLARVKADGGDPSSRVEAASALLGDVKGNPVVTSLGDPDTLVRQISFPRMPLRELAHAMEFEARKHMPYDPGRMVLRHQVLSEDRNSGTCQVLLVAVAREALREHQAMLRRLGLEPHAIEVAPLALANVSILATAEQEETTVVMDMGSSATVISIHRKEGIFFCRYLPFTLETRDEDGEVEGGSALEDLVVETRRSLAYYDNVTGRMGFSRVLIGGGGAILEGIASTLEQKLGLPVELLNPMEALQWDQAQPSEQWVARTAPLWAQALGLTLGH
jgi:type IV pilus assembly protein PilM